MKHQPALRQVIDLLRCPVCAAELSEPEAASLDARVRQVSCPQRHCFDVAKQGYISLLAGKGRTVQGDSVEQVRRREAFLERGYFQPVAAALAEAVREVFGAEAAAAETSVDREVNSAGALDTPTNYASTDPGLLLDCGAGTGYYLRYVLALLPQNIRAIGTEISVPAARRLAKAHPHAAALVCDTWRSIPLADAAVQALMVVFAPRNIAEFARLIRPGGALIMVWPGTEHLSPLRESAKMLSIEQQKFERIAADLANQFDLSHARRRNVRYEVVLPADAAMWAALMGPSGAHRSEDDIAELIAAHSASGAPVTIDVNLGVFPRIRG